MDGMPEVTFQDDFSPATAVPAQAKVAWDEQNNFERTIVDMTDPGGGLWYQSGYDAKVGDRVVIIIRRRPSVTSQAFADFVNTTLGTALNRARGVVELRTQAFAPYNEVYNQSPGVDHTYPPEAKFHGSIVLGTAAGGDDARTVMTQALSSVNHKLGAQLQQYCAAIYAFRVERTYRYVTDGQSSLPPLLTPPLGG